MRDRTADLLRSTVADSGLVNSNSSVLTQLRPKATGDRTQYSEFSSLIAVNKINRRDDVAGSSRYGLVN
uniref:Kinesin motor domain-containing protein n=1 Tax=Heterorhabditis bacteriophora TaxID=37862 RepID=A0A1I7WD92_HETBA